MNLPEEYRPCDWSEVVGQDKVIRKIHLLAKRGLAGRGYWIKVTQDCTWTVAY